MHIPGHGFLSVPVAGATWALATVAAVQSARRVAARLTWRNMAKAAALAAFVFVAQLEIFDFPAGGTSAHVIGGMLLAALAGPHAATVMMSAVLALQWALLGDGGFVSLGANILSMGVVGPWAGWAVYRSIASLKEGIAVASLGLFAGSWVSMVAAASACSIVLWASGASPLNVVLPSMVRAHAVAGIVEGLVTVAAVFAFRAVEARVFGISRSRA
ncbi:MAG: energy-coupling factor ABC transporter permease [Proteobacteria bacterium]|nr:energy-coupling factor ABC transporter permease [Pseudomonadota bacterium]